MKPRFHWTLILALLTVCAWAPIHAKAGSVFVSSPGGLGAHGSYDWDTLGLGSLSSGAHLTTAGGIGFTVSEPQDVLSVGNASSYYISQGGTDDFLLGNLHDPQAGPISLTFDSPVRGVGAYMEWGGYEIGSYTITAFDVANAVLLTQTVQSGPNGYPAFLGVLDSSADIKMIEFDYAGETGPHSIGLGDPSFATGTPEPGTIFLLGTLLAAFAPALRRRLT